VEPRSSRPEASLYVEIDYKIIYEDAFFMAVDKPAPLPIHKVGAFKSKNLLSLLLQKNLYPFLAPVNRLDSETSGVVLFAKSSAIAGKLGKQFENRDVVKEYLAIVMGEPDKKGSFTTALGWDESLGYRKRIADPNGETAQTDYEVLESRKGYSLVKILPKTGRTHQIRIHFALAGHPLVGDKIYIRNDIFEPYIQKGWQEWMLEIVKWPRLALHASRLTVKQPDTGNEIVFRSELPESLKKYWESV
jgi:23S rRNA pseudouridine1911/1915/1917 synthase